MNIPKDLRYTTADEWVRQEGHRLVIGITDFAQSNLGDVVYIEHPLIGTVVAAGDRLAEIESTKSVSEVYAPVGGRVIAANGEVKDHPELVNADPYGEGWICALEPEDADAFDDLLSADAYTQMRYEEPASRADTVSGPNPAP